jgi:hypothetical protein
MFDVGVVCLPVLLLFCLAAHWTVGWIRRRFSPDERLARGVGLAVASAFLVGIVFQAGNIWAFIAEEDVRLHTNHLSYRAFNLPWMRHQVAIPIVGMALFWIIVAATTSPRTSRPLPSSPRAR